MTSPAVLSDIKNTGRYALTFNAGVLFNTLPVGVTVPRSTDLVPGYHLSLDTYNLDPVAQTLYIEITVQNVGTNSSGNAAVPVMPSNPETYAPGLGIAGQGGFSGQQGLNMPAGGNIQSGATVAPPNQIGPQFFGADDITVVILGAIAALVGFGLAYLTLSKVEKILDNPAIATALPVFSIVLLLAVGLGVFIYFKKAMP